MKDITIVFHDDHVRSGATASMIDLISGLRAKYKIRAIIPNNSGDLALYLRDHEIEYIKCRYYSTRMKKTKNILNNILLITKNILKLIFSFIYYFKYRRFIAKSDIIYSNTSDNYFGIIASILFGKKHIIHIREFGLNDQGVTHFIGDSVFYSLALKYSDRVIVISKSLRHHILNNLRTTEFNNKMSLVYDDVHFERNNILTHEEFKHIKILIVGSINEGKGQEFVIDSIYELSKKNIYIYLGIAGDDTTDYSLYLKDKVNQLGLSEQIVFHGFCDDMVKLRSQYPFVVVASKSEAFGRITIEAMGNKQLVIASNTGANPELIEDEVNGFLYKSGCKLSFCETIEKIIKIDKEKLIKITDQGYLFSTLFSEKNASKKISNLIEEL